ncbi:uncharacterized protein Z519_01729 [Cladophialophora bantiana CBS 173.52]|uniref:Alpha/beta hydrolase fold-3 domain-containing protein n=1 Tax=Cladophialophora bantiana (strain ATCC 10958 / CBS 173.52 / CDC B-1940 / NIH 8579) TaxID=1442370 RepID=A0A0D2I4G3_CLAB1|nr:uncharacterized protein Z519_01729 [Cladophialophora bantiana CBS 173.52]KIW98145.1 hypothetical protein Z519_01729 [Cladophialophora bantiana CBS 173.52]
MKLLLMLLKHPLRSLIFSYSFFTQILLLLLRRVLLPHFPIYQSLRIQIFRAYLASAALTFPDLTHRLPVGRLSLQRARKIDESVPAYLIPGSRDLSEFVLPTTKQQQCVVIYAHGGGYARGEARMYVNYMERWVREAREANLDLLFLSVEYPLSVKESHPAQRNAFLEVYRYALDNDIKPENIVFMGDSAGGGVSVLAGLELKGHNLPQPAATVLISPWLDMNGKAYEGGNGAVETDYFIVANRAVPALAKLFIGDIPADSPEVNPLYHQPEALEGLSPQLILTGGAEFARYDSEKWAELCRAAGVECKLVIEWAQLHIYAVGSKFISPAVRRKTDGLIIQWIKDHVRASEKMIDGSTSTKA